MKYMDDRLGFVSDEDECYVMDDFGALVWVPFSIGLWFFSEH